MKRRYNHAPQKELLTIGGESTKKADRGACWRKLDGIGGNQGQRLTDRIEAIQRVWRRLKKGYALLYRQAV